MGIELRIICLKCDAKVNVISMGREEYAVEPCPCADAKPEEEEPIRLPYMTLARVLKQKVVTALYQKNNGALRELTGFLGTNDLRHVSSELHYFHELDDNGIANENLLKTSCKVLDICRIYNISHFDKDTGTRQEYIVDESMVA